jgi:hypothetical protein
MLTDMVLSEVILSEQSAFTIIGSFERVGQLYETDTCEQFARGRIHTDKSEVTKSKEKITSSFHRLLFEPLLTVFNTVVVFIPSKSQMHCP